MDKSKLAPSMIIAVGLIVSSLIISYSMGKLGDDIRAAGIYSRKVDFPSMLRIQLDEDSVVQLKTGQDPSN
jgi:hypothetical protein